MEGDLPDLKPRDRERKGAGIAAKIGAAGKSPFTGLVAAPQALPRTALERLLARLSATIGGQIALAGGLSLLLGGTLLLAHRALFGTAASRTGGAPDLGALTSSLRVRRPKRSRALDYLALAYKNELNLDDTGLAAARPLFVHQPASPAPQEGAPAQPAAAATAGAASAAAASAPLGTPAAEPTDWTQVLSAQQDWRSAKFQAQAPSAAARLNGESGAEFGAKNVFFSDIKAPKFGDGYDRKQLAALPVPIKQQAGARTSASAMERIRLAAGGRGGTAHTMRVRGERAISQLKAASGLSGFATSLGSAESAKNLATNAFDGKQNEGGAAPASPVDMTQPTRPEGTVKPLGSGAPGAPEAKGANVTEYQAQLEQAYKLGSQAADMRKQALMMLILGMALIAIGVALLAPPTTPAGVALLLAGTALVGMSTMMTLMSHKLGGQAKQIVIAIQRQYGQEAQGKIAEECMDQAVSEGARLEDCKHKTKSPTFGASGAAAAVQQEMDATYEIDENNGAPTKPQPEPASSPKPAAPPASAP